ncbi:MAG: gluconate 2-dehydrogenase subunit 3 family protein [Proteobacteria bacterium]|nr:gluconate 2-dehydrogenase subunit 3 family protein [Pseudomonadota bacterium]
MLALITRRRLLQMGIGAAVATAAGGGAVVLKPAAQGAMVLSAEEMATVFAITEVLFPKEPMGVSGLEAGVPYEVDRLVSEWLDDTRRPAFRYVLRGLEWGTYASRGLRFSALSLEDRHEVLEAWADPTVLPRRLAADSLKVLFSTAYFRSPEVKKAMGYVRLCGGGAA